jgi:hypothetical protein
MNVNEPKTPLGLRRAASNMNTIHNEMKLTDMEKKVGGFVAKKQLRKRGNYDSALDNYNPNELRQMDEALIGISNEMLK